MCLPQFGWLEFLREMVEYLAGNGIGPAQILPMELSDMSRREFETATFGRRSRALGLVSNQSYTKEALVARLGLTEPGDEAIVEAK